MTLNALLVIVSTHDSAPVIVGQRLRKGSCGSPRGARRLIGDAVATTRRLPGMDNQKILLRADSAYYGYPSISAAIKAGAEVSVTTRMTSNVTQAITQIPDTSWETIEYTHAVFDEGTGRWISSAEVAEIPFTAFTSRKKTDYIPGRLVVRRIPELNKKDIDQPGLFDLHRFHVVFTTADPDILDTVATDKTHRQHAIIEQVNADLKKQRPGAYAVRCIHSERGLAGVCGHGLQPHPHCRDHRWYPAGQGDHRDNPPETGRRPGPDRSPVSAAGSAPTRQLAVGIPVVKVVRSHPPPAGSGHSLTAQLMYRLPR